MKNQKTKIVLISIMIFMMSTVMAFAEEVDIVQVNADKYGVLTLIPPIVAIVLAFITKNVVISLAIGIMSGGFILNFAGINIFYTIIQAFLDLVSRAVESLADPWHAGIILQVLAIGGVIYTIGGIIYALKPKFLEFNNLGFHEIFHIFILLGSLCHFISIFFYLL